MDGTAWMRPSPGKFLHNECAVAGALALKRVRLLVAKTAAGMAGRDEQWVHYRDIQDALGDQR
jgi:hypothetical protein